MHKSLLIKCAAVILASVRILALVGLMLGTTEANATAGFAYDLSGRLVQAVAPNGAAAQYQYDAAGNLLGIQQIATGALAITSFAPASGPAGTVVTVAGTGFSLTASQNAVTIGGAPATVSSATADQLVLTVPSAAVTGPIAVSNASGSATSAANFVVGSLLGGGKPAAPVTFSSSTPATLTFNGNAGDGMTLSMSDVTTSAGGAVTATVAQPGGAVLANCSSNGTTLLCTLPVLPVAGTYTVTFAVATGTGSGAVQLIPDQTGGVLSPNAAVTFAPNIAAPAVSYTFTVGSGESGLGLALSADTIPGNTSVVVYNQNGTTLTNTTLASTTGATQLGLGTLASGTYRVRVIPGGVGSGSMQISLTQLNSGATLPVGGESTAVTLLAGQNGKYTFNGTQGQFVGIGVTNLSLTQSGAYLSFTITDADGTHVASFTTSSATSYAMSPLPVTGVYTLTVDPGTSAANFNLFLSSDQTGTLVLNGTPVTWTNAKVGQFATYSFAATAGQSYVLDLSSATIQSGVTLDVYLPDGALWISQFVAGNGPQVLTGVPQSGTYKVRVVPYGAYTGSVTLSLLSPQAGSIALGSPPLAGTVAAGETASYSFSGTAGQLLGVALTNFSSVPGGGYLSLTLFDSSGTTLANCNVFTSQMSRINGGGCALPPLPASDNYTVVVTPGPSNTASFNIQLTADQTGTLVANAAPSVFASAAVAQNASYSFAGLAGQNYVFTFTADTFLGTTTAYAYNPDGSLANTVSVGQGGIAVLKLAPLPTTGAYLLRIEPTAWEAATDSISVGLTNTTSSNNGITAGAAATPVSIAAGQTATYTFSGTQGQNLGLGLTNFATTPASQNVTVTVTDSSGTQLASFNTAAATGYALPTLPVTDIYTVTISPGAAAAAFNLQLTADQTATLAVNGTPAVFTSSTVGQYATYSFAGTAGQNYATSLGAISFTTYGDAYVYKPDGTLWTSTALFGSSAQMNLSGAPATGTYTVRVGANGAGTGSVAVGITQSAASATLNAGGAAVAVNLIAGQNGTYTFNGTQGQNLGLGITNFSATPAGQYVTVTVTDSNATQLALFTASSATGYALPTLPVTGPYTVTVDPGGAAATLNLQLTTDQTATLAVNGTPAVFTSSTVGQYATYSFVGTAGQNYAVALSTPSFTTYGIANVYKPDGSLWTSQDIFGKAVQINLSGAPVNGSYTVRVGSAGTGTGGVTVGLTLTGSTPPGNNSAGILTPGATPTSVSVAAGQTATYIFSGTQGQNLGLGLTNFATTPAGQNVTVTVVDSSGTQLTSFNASATTGYALPALPVTGTYTVTVSPGAAAAGFNLQLTADQTATLAVNGAPAALGSSTVGQYETYSFAGTAGQKYAVSLSAINFTTYGDAYVYKPDGSLWTSTALFGSSAQMNLSGAPVTGTYTVRVGPTAAGTGSVTVGITQGAASATLKAGGAAVAVSLIAGQNGTYTFNGTQGQNLGLGLTNFSTTPAGQNVTVTVVDSSGTQLTSFNTSAATGYALPALPATDTYTVTVNPGAAAASFSLQLTTDQTATLTVNAAPVVFTSSAAGQNATYSFSAAAGQNYSLTLTADTFPGSTYVYIYKRDGTLWTSTYFSGGSTQFKLLGVPVAGTYTVRVEPNSAVTGSVAVAITQNGAGGVLNVNGAAVAVSLIAGQNGTYTFSGAKGQNLGLGLTNFATTPAAQNVTVTVTDSSGTRLTSFNTAAVTGYALPTLPLTDTYTVTVSPGSAAATFNLQLSADLTATLVVNGATAVLGSSTVGQYETYSFAGTAAQSYAVVLSAPSFTTNAVAYIYKPDGSLWTSQNISASAAQINLPGAPATGTYTVRVEPNGAGTGSITVGITQTAAGATLSAGGDAIAVNLIAGQNGTYTFSGTQGQNLGLGVTNLVTTPAGQSLTGTVIDPAGRQLASYATSGPGAEELPTLPVTGTYTVTASAGAAAANFNLHVTADQTATLSVDGAPTVFTSNTVGQYATYSFAATAGQNYTVTLTAASFTTFGIATVYNPDGSASGGVDIFGSGAQINLWGAPVTGTYTVRLGANGPGTGSVAVGFAQNAAGAALNAGGAAQAVNLIAGQNGTYTFNGTRGQNLGLGLTNLTTAGQYSVTVSVTDSNGTSLASFIAYSSMGYALPTLPVTGTYTVTIDPGPQAESFNLQLTADQTATLAVNGAPTVFTPTMVGQYATYSFAGTAGQNYAVALSADSFSTNGVINVYKPDGTLWTSQNIFGNPAQINLSGAPATGTYTVRLGPTGAGTGSITVGLSLTGSTTPVSNAGTLTAGAAPTSVSIAAGQTATYAFSGAQGQNLGLGLTNLATTPAGQTVTVKVADSTGNQLLSFNTSAATGYALPTLPGTEANTVTVNPGSAAASFNLQITADQTATLAVNGAPVVFTSSTVGQNATYSFSGVAGLNYSLVLTADSFPGLTYVYIYKPDGTLWTSAWVSAGSSTQLNLPGIPIGGTYTVRVEPPAGATGSLSVGLTLPNAGAAASFHLDDWPHAMRPAAISMTDSVEPVD